MSIAGVALSLLAGIAAFSFGGIAIGLLVPFVFIFLLLVFRNWKAGYWLLILSIPVSVMFDIPNTGLSTSIPDEPIVWLYFGLLLLLLAAQPSRLKLWFLSHPIAVIIIIQFLWLLVTVAWSQEQMLSLKFLVAKTWYLAVFFLFPLLIFNEKKDYKNAFVCFLIPLMVTMVIIIIRHAAKGYGFMEINGAIGLWYYNHVEYSAVLSMFFPFVVMAFQNVARKRSLLKLLLLLLICFFAVAIFFTYARAAILAVFFALAFGLAIRLRLANLMMPVVYIVIIAAMAYLAKHERYMAFSPNFEQTYMHKNLTDHILATFQGRDMSSMERVYRWIAAVRMSSEHPITGFGPHAFVEHYKPYTVPAFKTYVSGNPEKSTTHNYLLLMLTEQGWPGMLLYVLLIPLALASAQRTYHRFRDPFYKNCTLGVAMMLAASFINNFFSELIETHKVGAMFYIGLALLIILSRKSKLAVTTTPKSSQ